MPASSLFELDSTSTMVSNSAMPHQTNSIDDDAAMAVALNIIHGRASNTAMYSSQFPSYEDPNHMMMSDADRANRRSQNMTECVAVPSSEHVAEIVGRQGCKIKALRAKTNTYIKTPVRGEEPVFVVTGRKEDVGSAKREILSAADHFSQIRACRKNNMNGSMAPGPPTNVPGQVTISVRVPYRVVGLVVGPKGATIKRIQQTTQTYIVTPSRDKEPVFEVTGLPDNAAAARTEIEAHIAMRTGNVFDEDALVSFAVAHKIPLEALINNTELMNYYKGMQLNGGNPGAGTASSSLNAMLSNTNTSHGVINSASSSGISSFGGSHLGHSSFSPLSTTSLAGSFNFPGKSNSQGSSTDMQTMLLENQIRAGFSNGLNLGGVSNNHSIDTSPFSILGEAANHLLNTPKNGSVRDERLPAYSQFDSNLMFNTGSSGLRSNLGGAGNLDEGLGSLGSSMGSSPALDQPQNTHNIWGDSNFSSLAPGFHFPSHQIASGENSPHALSPPHHGARSEFSSMNDAQLEALNAALTQLNVGANTRSNNQSPELLVDFNTPISSASGFDPNFHGRMSSSPVTSTAADRHLRMDMTNAGRKHLPGNDSTLNILASYVKAQQQEAAVKAAAEEAAAIASLSRRGSLDAASSPTTSSTPASSATKSVCSSCQNEQLECILAPCCHLQKCLHCAKLAYPVGSKCSTCQVEVEDVRQIKHT